ncbi:MULTISPECIES: sulfotransferase family protein [Winogradskyella]|uniref:sulfotransferase family protein n=1 Tax=Winogradskyella TaxID=286104 RepID=UPI0015C87E42|nr:MULTISPECIES: sulfotransferase [Winogradskyella]QXP78204.1 sulfotransferase [Winogradskyella sp. HaHa_3_26]
MSIGKFYILGNPRSGTSLLRLLLNSHSLITVPPECGFFLWLAPKYINWDESNLNSKNIQEFIEDVQASKKFETWNLSNQILEEIIKRNKPKNYNELSLCVYLSYAFHSNKMPKYVGDKNNYYINYLHKLDDLSPDALVVHLVRDGRDVVNSYREISNVSDTYKYKPNLPFSIPDIAKEWQKNNLNIFNFYKDKSNYLIVRYEDLLERPDVVLTELLKKLSLSFESKMLDFYKENALKQIEPKETLAWKLKTLKPLDKSNIGVYKEKLMISEIEEFNSIAHQSLKLFGYDA